jgi:hypothetical protein
MDTGAEHDYCGECGRSCSREAVCSQGNCRVECASELVECETGSCYDLDSNADHCGSCENQCERSSHICVNGSCRPYIFPGPSCWHCPCTACSEVEMRCCIIGEFALPVCVDAAECP